MPLLWFTMPKERNELRERASRNRVLFPQDSALVCPAQTPRKSKQCQKGKVLLDAEERKNAKTHPERSGDFTCSYNYKRLFMGKIEHLGHGKS